MSPAEMVAGIQSGDESAVLELYRTLEGGFRWMILRQLGPDEMDDRVHDVFGMVVAAIQRGELREPDRLIGFVRTIARRAIAGAIEDRMLSRGRHGDGDAVALAADPRATPEQLAIGRERIALTKRLLQEMPARDREILTRFYLLEQPREQICEEMDLTDTQFRLFKSRAKARVAELGRRYARRPLPRAA